MTASAPTPFSPRAATPQDIGPLASLWHDAWHETQAPHLPRTLKPLRTLKSFQIRADRMGNLLRTSGPVGAPLGFCAIKAGELDQLYLDPHARGTGIAAALLADGEARLRAQGDARAFLICLPENTFAVRFYLKHGWRNTGLQPSQLDTLEGPFTASCLVFRKDLPK